MIWKLGLCGVYMGLGARAYLEGEMRVDVLTKSRWVRLRLRDWKGL